MTPKEIKIQLVMLGKKQKQLIPELERRGIKTMPCELSTALSDIEKRPPKMQKIYDATEEIIENWRKEQGM